MNHSTPERKVLKAPNVTLLHPMKEKGHVHLDSNRCSSL